MKIKSERYVVVIKNRKNFIFIYTDKILITLTKNYKLAL